MKQAKRAGLILLTFFALCTLPYKAGGQETPKPVPKMVLKEKFFDFGEVREGDHVEHLFVVSNTGNAPLEIRNVRPG